MGKIKSAVGVLALVVGLGVLIVLQHQNHKSLLQENQVFLRQAKLQESFQQKNAILASNQPLISPSLSAEQLRELLQLRGTVTQLRMQRAEAENASTSLGTAIQAGQALDPMVEQFYRSEHGKQLYGLHLGQALIQYASQHQGQFPENITEAALLLRAEAMAQTNFIPDHFELIYHGKLEELTLPPEAAIIARERTTRQRPDGFWERTYIKGDGGVVTTAQATEEKLAEWEHMRMAH